MQEPNWLKYHNHLFGQTISRIILSQFGRFLYTTNNWGISPDTQFDPETLLLYLIQASSTISLFIATFFHYFITGTLDPYGPG